MSDAEVNSGDPLPSPHYTLKSWGGLTQYQCNYCPYDTLEGEGEIINHIYKCHRERYAPELPAQAKPSGRHKNRRR